jgi:hypothetical protein
MLAILFVNLKRSSLLCSLFSHYPGARGGAWTQTVDLGMTRRVFDHCATPASQLSSLLNCDRIVTKINLELIG